MAFVADSGSNMKCTMGLFNDQVEKIPCAAHKLNSAVNDLFKIKNIRLKKDKESQLSYYVVRDFDEIGNSRDISLSDSEKEKIENMNKIKNNVLIPLINK